MQKEIKKITYNGNSEELSVIYGAENVYLRNLGLINEKCSLFESEIKLTKLLGKGSSGEVFEYEEEGKLNRDYVIKKSGVFIEQKKMTKEEIMKYLNRVNLSIKDIAHSQMPNTINSLTDKKVPESERLVFTLFNECLVDKDRDVILSSGQTLKIKAGSILCKDKYQQAEFIISELVGKLYKNGICINFFETQSLFICPTENEEGKRDIDTELFDQYIFMDKMDGDISSAILHCMDPITFKDNGNNRFDIMDSIFVQSVFAIALYQEKFRISHNDVRTRNLMYKSITKETTFNGILLHDKTYFHYEIGNGKGIFIMGCPIIVKFGDFGASVMYTKEENNNIVIGNEEVISQKLDIPDRVKKAIDSSDPWGILNPVYITYTNLMTDRLLWCTPPPITYTPHFDLVQLTKSFVTLKDQKGSLMELSPLILECKRAIETGRDGKKIDFSAFTNDKVITAYELLHSVIYKRFGSPLNTKESSVTIGSFTKAGL